jgi:hypothetical protein
MAENRGLLVWGADFGLDPQFFEIQENEQDILGNDGFSTQDSSRDLGYIEGQSIIGSPT